MPSIPIWFFVIKIPKKTAKELPAIIERMPQVPLLRNHLFVALRRLGKHNEAFAVNDQALKDHPDYIYAVMNKAVQHWENGELDEVEKVLGGMPLVINRTFPERKVFHIMEVLTYYGFLVRFWVTKGNHKSAESYYNLLEELEPGHPQLPELKSLLTFSNLKSAFGKLMEDIEKSKQRKENRKKKVQLPQPKKKGGSSKRDLFGK
jgi:tetratricopeptide (TPR) repeat protein